MDTVLRCAGIAVMGAILALVTKKHSGEFAVLVSIAVVLLLTTMVLGLVKPVLGFVESLQDTAELGGSMVSPVIKSLAIGFLTETGKNICEDAGEKTMANALALAGNIGALYVLLPLMQSLLDLMETLI